METPGILLQIIGGFLVIKYLHEKNFSKSRNDG